MSGTTFFTLGLGDVTPHTSAERIMAVFESGLGLGFLALIISYLPVIYQAFSRREVSIVLLDARAGSPPTAAELLSRHGGQHGVQAIQVLLQDWERWSAELLESHISYPVVAYFRSQHSNESWLAALTAILDTTALIVATSDSTAARARRNLTFAMCRHTIVDLSQVFHASSQQSKIPIGFRPPISPASALRWINAATSSAKTTFHRKAARAAPDVRTVSPRARALFICELAAVDSGEENHRQLEDQRLGQNFRHRQPQFHRETIISRRSSASER